MSEAAVTSKGQITIPVGIRKSLRLKAQDRVVFTRLVDGTVVMRAKVRSIARSGRQRTQADKKSPDPGHALWREPVARSRAER